jgi:hypothetical protein
LSVERLRPAAAGSLGEETSNTQRLKPSPFSFFYGMPEGLKAYPDTNPSCFASLSASRTGSLGDNPWVPFSSAKTSYFRHQRGCPGGRIIRNLLGKNGRQSAFGSKKRVRATMAHKKPIDQIVEEVVSQVLEGHLPELRKDLIRRVLEEVQPHLGGTGGASGSGAADLLRAVSAIHAGTTQKEILRALLESTAGYSGRAALFVMKAGSATGWQGRGFDKGDDVKDFSLDMNSPTPARVLQSRAAVSASAAEMDPKFISQFGAPAEDQVLLLPLHLKDKVAALVYADAGTGPGGKMDAAAFELIVAATSAWLEVASLRKQALKEGAAEAGSPEKFEAPPVQTVSSFSDPFAAHAPKHVVADPVAVEATAMAEATAEVVSAASSMAAAAVAPATDAFAHMSAEDADVHRKAQRFARLLMDEIKLYNQAKVAEGRKHKDLYDRLKEDIDKSRSTYQKRYGNTVAASADYFSSELIRSLAEDDVSLLGPNFHR